MVNMGTVLFPFFFNWSIQYSVYFQTKHFCFCFNFLLLTHIIVQYNGGEKEDYIKSELIDGGSPRHDTFSNFFC